MMAVVCTNVKCKFPFSIDPKKYQWQEVPGPAGANGKPKKAWVAAIVCPTCNEPSRQSRLRKP